MNAVINSEKKIRIGIWGLGRGQNFIRQCQDLNFEIAAGCDLNQTLRDDFRKLCPDAFITDNEDEFLNHDFDVVLVATFFMNHARDSIKALEHGKHVISEVAAFFTPADGVALVEAVEKSGKLYCLAENYTDHFVKKLWQEGVFGELSYAEFDYVHEGRSLCYSYVNGLPLKPGNVAHSWRSWLNYHYYCTHSLGAAMEITGTRPVRVIAPDGCKQLPGYLEGGEMGSMKPSFVIMDNGGVIRNLLGSATADVRARKIWGTRAFVDLTESTPTVGLGQTGKPVRIKLTPPAHELDALAAKAGHHGGDFWVLYNFADAFFNGTPLYWNIYAACDVTLAGIMAVKSEAAHGMPVDIPDFRDKAVREQYRHDYFAQEHFDPAKIFPDDQNLAETKNFTQIMSALDQAWRLDGVPQMIAALDGIKLYKFVDDPDSEFAIQTQVRKLLHNLDALADALDSARKLSDKYPDSLGGKALASFLAAACPEKMADPKALRQELCNWLISPDQEPYRQMVLTLDEKEIAASKLPEIPEGFILRTFRPGDEEKYIELMRKAGFEVWNRDLLNNVIARALDDGIFFLEDVQTGTLAATAMANKMRAWESDTGPEFGWLGVAPEFRGKRLAQVVCQAVQDRFRREGFKKIYLRTDDYRLAAIKTYLALNWQPLTDSQDMIDRWKTIRKKLNLPC